MPRAGAGGAGGKKGKGKAHQLPERFPPGEVLYQPSEKKHWRLGDVIGQGGFGLIYNASEAPAIPDADPQYVIKIEPQDNGPLFCELHFYQRAAKPEMIREWAKAKKLKYLAVPQFLGTGLHKKGDRQYRFVVLQRLGTDLQKVFEQNNRSFSEKTACSIGLRMLDALEYIHEKGYVHADIKAANILLGHSDLKGVSKGDQVYLVDYGLAYRFVIDGTHKPYKEDPKRAHDGTAEYTSRDAHKGVLPSRRGDLEILGYCLLEWTAGRLPWSYDLNDKNRLSALKTQYMSDIEALTKACFGASPCPEGIKKYLNVVSKLAYDERPDYNQLRQFLRSGTSNEWTLGLTEGAKGTKRKNGFDDELLSPKAPSSASKKPAGAKANAAKGVKRKNDAGDGQTPPKVARVLSPQPASPAKARGAAVKVKPSASNSKAKPSSPRKNKPGGAAKVTGAASGSSVKIPGAAKRRAGPAKVAPKSPAKGAPKSPAKVAPKSPAKRGASSPAIVKAQARTPQKASPVKRKRGKKTMSDSAVQTSPGFALTLNGNH